MNDYFELYEVQSFWWFCVCLSFLIGASLASFCDCLASRIVSEERLSLFSRSRCDSCETKLGILDLIPVFSFLFRRGRCKYCGGKIPIRYLFSEIVGGVITLALWLNLGLSIKLAEGVLIYFVMHIVSLVDIETREIPNAFFVILISGFFAMLPFREGLTAYIISATLGGVAVPFSLLVLSKILEKKKGKMMLGGGDIKILIGIGLFLGGYVSVINILLMSVFGLAYCLIKKRGNEAFAFAPFIMMSTLVCILFGEKLLAWYLAVLA